MIDDKSVIRYANANQRLEKVLEKLTKDFCKNNCDIEDPIGCCHGPDFYRTGFGDNLLLLVNQQEEAIGNGWKEDSKIGCKYYIDGSGCPLVKYKPPFCVGYICHSIKQSILGAYERDNKAVNFVEAMDDLFSSLIPFSSKKNIRKTIKKTLRAARSGEKLIKLTPKGVTPYEFIIQSYEP